MERLNRCNPFGVEVHKRKRSMKLAKINAADVNYAKKLNINLIRGQKICSACRLRVYTRVIHNSTKCRNLHDIIAKTILLGERKNLFLDGNVIGRGLEVAQGDYRSKNRQKGL